MRSYLYNLGGLYVRSDLCVRMLVLVLTPLTSVTPVNPVRLAGNHVMLGKRPCSLCGDGGVLSFFVSPLFPVQTLWPSITIGLRPLCGPVGVAE